MYWKYQYRQQHQQQKQQTTLPPTASSSPSSLNSGELHGRTLPQQAIINVLGVLLMMALVFVTVALLSQKKSCRRNSSSSTMRYCRNGGQSFQLVPSSPAAADGSDHGGRNGRMWSFKCYKLFYDDDNHHYRHNDQTALAHHIMTYKILLYYMLFIQSTYAITLYSTYTLKPII